MTEQEWLECADAGKMLEFLEGKASARKLRLFAVACCHRIWDRIEKAGRLVDEQACVQPVLLAEQFAEGMISLEKLAAVGQMIDSARVPCPRLCVGMGKLQSPMPTQSRGHGTQKTSIQQPVRC